MRQSFPAMIRVRVGELADGKRPQRRMWFDLAQEVGAEGSEIRYTMHQPLMLELARVLGYEADLRDGRIVILQNNRWTEFRPRRIPIEMLSDNAGDFLRIVLARWRRSGPDCEGFDFRPKTAEELEVQAQQAALRAQGLPTEPTQRDIGSDPAFWVGTCFRYTYKDSDQGMAQVGRETGICDPLTCPHFRSRDKHVVPCKPDVRFHFRLPWAGQRSWAWFCSTSWRTASKLSTTIADLRDNLGGVMRGAPCLLLTQPERVRAPDGRRQKQPIVYIGTDRPILELRAHAQTLLALQQGVYNADLKVLPTPEQYATEPGRVEALVREFHPEVTDTEIVGPEEEWRKRALAAGLTEKLVEEIMYNADGDLEALEAALQLQLKNGTRDEC